MKIAFNQHGKARRQMIDIIAETVQDQCLYSKAPKFEYRAGDFTLDKEGTLIFDSATIDMEQLRQVLNALKAAGFEQESSDSLSIGYPKKDFTEENIQNLRLMVHAKADLIKKALGVDELPIEESDSELIFPWFRAGLSRDETFAFKPFQNQDVCDIIEL